MASKTTCQLKHMASRASFWKQEFPGVKVGPHGILCKICQKANVNSLWASGKGGRGRGKVWLSHIKQHTETRAHRLAAGTCNSAQVKGHALVNGVVVPHATVFRSVIQCIQQKENVNKTKVGKRSMKRKLLYCLGQAARMLTLKKLDMSSIVSLQQDPRKHRMALRYSACSKETMEHFHGFLGVFDQAEHQDLTAVGCRDATVGILKKLCSPSSPVPYKSDMLPLDFPEVFDSLQPKIEQFCSDAAGDELVASELLQQDFQNLRVRSKDSAHAARRIASRCTKADGYLNQVLRCYVTGPQSPAQLLQFRPYFAKRFANMVKANNGWRCKNLRAAKHRFESIQKPTGRLVLHMRPLLICMESLCRERVGKVEGNCAKEFLDRWNVEEALTLAALADAHDEAFLVTRVADSDGMEPSDLLHAMQQFLKNIDHLFTNGHLWNMPGTYSSFLMETLKVPLLLIHKGKQLVLGGERAITPEIKHRVLGRFLGFGGRSNMSLLLLFLYTK
ncbi:unnamed protein product [Cladocopium goreaui]|uniref:Uncharacterized protein n=1 Tax=Cladocopium goreaui TaxID=2562237 RepID=A0A9P1FEJ2_9DINO|nr:unnamed protein product [Cladocopium goreaui]